MVAIVSSSWLGIGNSSLTKLGQQGVFGTASQGNANESVYVNVANGNLVLQDLDNTLAGLGGGIATLRTYNSEGDANWRIGPGSESLTVNFGVLKHAREIYVNLADGSQRAFTYVTDSLYQAADIEGGATDTLTRQADGSWLLTDGSTGEKSIYAGSGNHHLLVTIDANGNTTTHTYGSTGGQSIYSGSGNHPGKTKTNTYGTNGRLASVSDANGETVYYDYDASDNLVGVRSVVGDGTTATTTSVVTYTYDSLNRLTSASVDLSPLDGSAGGTYTTSYAYDGTSNRITSVTGADGTELTLTYVYVTAPYQSGGTYEVASITDGKGATTTFSYDPVNMSTVVTDGAGTVTTYQYDYRGNLTNVLADRSVNGTTQATPVFRFTYDQNGERVSQVWNEGTVTQYAYDGLDGPLMSVTQWQSPLGQTPPGSTPLQSQTVYTTAPNGKVLTSTVYPNPGSLDGTTAPSGALTTRNVYDANGNLIFQISPDGNVTRYLYATDGLLQSVIKYTGSKFDVSSYGDDEAPSADTMSSWVASLTDLSQSSRTDFTYDVRGQVAAATVYRAVLADGNGDPSTAAVTHYVYGPNGELLSTISPTGQQSSTTYDGLGRVLTHTDAEGHTTVTQYDDANRSVTTTMADGTQTITVRDADGRIISVAHVSSQGQTLGTTLYQYDAAGHLLMMQDPTGIRTYSLYDDRGYKVADIDGNGVLTAYTRDIDGRVTSETVYATPINSALLVDGSGNAVNAPLASVLPTTSTADQTTTYTYDALGRIVQTISPAGIATVTVYDGASRVLWQTTYATPVGASGIPQPSASDRTVRHFYDADGNVIGVIDATGALTTYRYDAAGRLIQTTRYANRALTPAGNDTVLADYLPDPDPKHDTSTFTLYDARGEIVGQIDGDGYLTETVYDASGNVTRLIRYATPVSYTSSEALFDVRPGTSSSDQVTQYSYTLLNQVATKTTPDGTVTQYVYDAMGRLVTTIASAGTADVRTLTERYDSLGRLVGELTGNGSALLAQATTQSQIDAIWAQYGVTYTYDAAGRRTSATDADGHRTLYYYDADGRLTSTVDAFGEVTQTVYDAFGRVSSTIAYGTRIDTNGLTGGVTNTDFTNRLVFARNPQLDRVATYTYNLDGTEASSTDANGKTTLYQYDSFGDRVSATQPLDATHSIVTDYAYDADGRLTTETDDALGVAAQTITRYDAFGRVISSTDAKGNTTSYQYDRDGNRIASTDALGNTTTVSYDAFGRVLTRTDPLGATTTYAYDEATRTTIVTTPEGIRLTTELNEFGQTETVTDGNGNVTNYSYDANGNLISVTTALSHTSNTYDAANNLISTTDANGTVTTYSYDAVNRVLARVVDPNGLKLATLYRYDALGRKVSTTDPTGVVTLTTYDLDGNTISQTVDPNGLNLTTRYAYDAAGRQITVTSPGGTVTQYQYDGLGRRISQTVDPGGANLTTSYTYDANGNVLTRTDPAGQTSYYAYDADNREIYAVDATGSVTATQYDADGRVTRTTSYATAISTTGLTPDASAIAARIVATSARDETQYRIYDLDGRVIWAVDGTGAATSHTYDADGNVVRMVTYANRIDMSQWGSPGFLPTPVADAAHDRVTRTVYDVLDRAIYSVDGMGAVTETHYDAAGNVIAVIGYATRISPQTPATQAALAAAVATIANAAADRHIRNVYDAAGRLVYTANGVGAVTHYVYDNDGRIVRTVAYAQTIASTASPSSVIASAGDRTTDAVYDSAGRLDWTVDASGAVTHNVYDANGNVVQTVAYANSVAQSATPYSAVTLLGALAIDGEHDRVTTNAYDSANRLVLSVDALGDVTRNVYDATGHVVEKTQYAQPLQVSFEGVSASSISLAALSAQIQSSPATDRTTRYAFDADGRERYSIDPLGYVTEMRYDAIGNIVAKTQYALAVSLSGTVTASQVAAAIVAQPGADRASTFTYDATGNLIASSDGLGYTETYAYDGVGNKRSYTNKNGNTWVYDYDAAGNLIRQTSPQVVLTSVQADANGNASLNWGAATQAAVVTTYSYDAFGHVVSMTEAAGRPEQRTTRYVYDAAGRQIRTIYPPVNVYASAADNLAANGEYGNAARVEYTNATLSDTVYYDAFGDSVANVDTGGNVSLKAYDKLGRVAYAVDGDGYVTSYTHDTFGDVTRLVRFGQDTSLPSSVAAALNADSNGSVFSITRAQIEAVVNAASFDHGTDRAIQTTYDRLGRAVQVVDPQSFVYDSAAPAGAQYFTAGKTTRTTYDAFGDAIQLSSLVNPLTNAWNVTTQYFDRDGRNIATVDPLGYVTTMSYDAAGNLVQRTQYANATSNWNASAYSMPTASAQDRTVLYAYDADNRKTSQTQVNANYSTASNGTSTVGNLTTRYTYDGVGNLTSTTTADGTSTISYYDALGRVSAVAQGNTAGAGSAAPLTEYYRDAYGNVLAQVQHAQGSNYATLQGYSAVSSSADRITYTQYNNRGDVIALTDGNGNTVFSSYTADDHLAKQWQTVTAADGSNRTWFEAYQYDADGNRVAVIDPASTSVLQSGITTSYQSSSAITSGNSIYLNGTNSVTVNWSSLVNSTGGAVRVDVVYNTVSTLTQTTVPVDESGVPLTESGAIDQSGQTTIVTTGAASQAASRSFTYSASQAQGGATMSWSDQYATIGGISQLTYIRVWQQDASGNWQALWEGSPAQANGSGIAQVSQQQAGVDVQRTTYDAFGEVVGKGIDGGQQVYYDYDNAGNLWKTNSNNGTDTVNLYDLAGDRTATITSAGSASDNIDLRAIGSADQAASLTDVRRTDTVYNALGYAVKVIEPQQTVVYGGAQVGNIQSQAVIAQSTSFVPDGTGSGVWYGTNQLNLSWPSLAGLGNGDVKVELDYITASASYSSGGTSEGGTTDESGSTDESGATTATTTIASRAASITRTLTAAQANGGTVFSWTDPSGPGAGGVSQVTGIKLWKMGADGAWHQVFSQSALNQNGSYIAVGAPPDASTNVALQIAPSGSGQWQTIDPSQFVDFGDQYRFDASGLPYGSYDFRVLTTPQGGQASVTAQGSIAIGVPQVASVDIPMGFNQPGTSPGVFAWQSQGSGTTVIFNYKAAGSNAWQSLPVSDLGLGLQGVDMSAVPPGQYQYEVLYVHNGQWQAYGHSTGVVAVTPPVGPQYVPPVGLPVITAPISVGQGLSGGEWAVATDESGNPIYDAAVPSGATQTNVVHWVDVPGQNAVFEYQPAGSSNWYTLPVNAVTVTSESGNSALLDESGNPLTYYGVDIGGLPLGNYAFQILYYQPGASTPDAHATGNLSPGGIVPGYWQTQYTTVEVPYTAYPPAPSNYIIGVDESGQPIYGPPVVLSYNEDGSANLGPGYVWSAMGNVLAEPYTAYQQETRATNVWVPPVGEPASISLATPPYQPGYTTPGTPPQYYSSDTTGSATEIESEGVGAVGQLVGGAATGATVQSNRPVINETVDRWGDVLSMSDPRSASWVTQYTYNQNNQLITEVQPSADGVTGAGATTSIYYDALGRRVATRDANGNVNGFTYDAQGDVTAELHADGGAIRYTYDALGDKTSMVDAMGNTTLYGYDHMGRLLSTEQANGVQVWNYNGSGAGTQLVSNGPLIETVQYDQRGEKIVVRDAAGETTQYAYDLRGDVTQTVKPLGQVTRDAYDAEGHKVAEVDADNNAQTWRYDYFGQLLGQTDIGGAQYFYTYDNARQLLQQTNTRGQNQTYSYDVAGQVTQIVDTALGQVTQYAYDASGNRIREVTSQGGVIYQDNHLAYDALGRLREVQDGNVNIVYAYDANGNRTHIRTQYMDNGTHDAAQDMYFAYDSMNRETVADAYDANLDISASQGHVMTYDASGNRTSDTSIGAVLGANGQKTTGVVTQRYAYDSLNRLMSTTYNGTLIDQREYDADSRVVSSGLSGTSQSFFDTLGLAANVQFNAYDGAGRLVFQRNYNANLVEQDNVSYTQYDAVGNVLQYQMTSVPGTAYTNTYTNTLVRYAGYEVASEQGTSTVLQPGTTTYQYDVNGNLIGVSDSTDGANNRSFVNDVSGQILQKTQGSAVERELIAHGQLVGTTGTGTDPNGPTGGPTPTFVDLTNFDPTYRPINSNYPAPTPGAYTVSAGDTLQSIAQGAYGDSKLWYLIADANGLSGNNDMKVGQTLNIPNRVADIHNSAGDFKPYDASTVVGGTQPNLPQPPADGGGGCGGLLGIIALVIVVVVTVLAQQYEAVPAEVSAGAGAEAGAGLISTMETAATLGAAVDAGGQLIGDALGTHQGFDLVEVAETAAIAGATAGMPGAGADASFGAQALHGALSNALTQGVRLALHQQESFNWMQVALSAAAAPLANEVGQSVGTALKGLDVSQQMSAFTQGMVSNTVREVATGGKVSLTSVATDAFGNALAVEVPGQTSGPGQQEDQLGQTQQQVMQDSEVGQPGDAGAYGPGGDAWAAAGGDVAPANTYGAGSVLLGPTGDVAAMASEVAASNVGAVGGAASPFIGTTGSYAVASGDSYASVANEVLGDERYASLLMYANGVAPTYATIHGLQAGATLNVPDASGFSDAQLSALLSNGGQLLSADQRETDQRIASANQLAGNAAAAAAGDAGGNWSAADIEYLDRITAQAGVAGAGGGMGFASSTLAPLGLQERASSTDVRGGFDGFGNSTAGRPEFDLGSALTTPLGALEALRQKYEAGNETMAGWADAVGLHGLADLGRAWTSDTAPLIPVTPLQAGLAAGAFALHAGPLAEGGVQLAGEVGAALDLGPALERQFEALASRNGALLSVMERGPTFVGEGAVPNSVAAGAPYQSIVGRVPGRILSEADALNPGPLGDDLTALPGTFSGGRYATMQLDKPLTVYRAWTPGQSREFGAFWSLEEPAGSLQTRIDSALLPEWGNIRGTPFGAQASQYTTIELPAGTTIHIGEVGSQGDTWVGGGSQLLIEGGPQEAWKIGQGILK